MSNSSGLSLCPVSIGPFGDEVGASLWRSGKPAPGRPALHPWLISNATLRQALPTRSAEPAPYLLVLLADQEIDAKRQEEAQSLIEAAYAAYDQCNLGS
jgi:hypothetical protein